MPRTSRYFRSRTLVLFFCVSSHAISALILCLCALLNHVFSNCPRTPFSITHFLSVLTRDFFFYTLSCAHNILVCVVTRDTPASVIARYSFRLHAHLLSSLLSYAPSFRTLFVCAPHKHILFFFLSPSPPILLLR